LRVFDNKVLRRKFGPKNEKVTGAWRNYVLNFIICMLRQTLLVGKITLMRLVGREARMVIRSACRSFNRKLNGGDHFEDLSIDERIILKFILNK
jgi:hypothetical protein